jgi:hypothetical protein
MEKIMSEIESVEIFLNYDEPKSEADGVIAIKSVTSKDGSGTEIKNNYSELTQGGYFSIAELIEEIASHLNVKASAIKIMNAIAWVEVKYSVDYKNMDAVEIASVISKDEEDRTLKMYNDLTCYPSQCFPTGIQTAEADIIKYVVSKLEGLNVDSNMIQISEAQ